MIRFLLFNADQLTSTPWISPRLPFPVSSRPARNTSPDLDAIAFLAWTTLIVLPGTVMSRHFNA
jgi:hypothetical protein